jgi:hypothetical protein
MGVPEADRIADSLLKLNDSDTLTRTRQVSNFFSLSVARWLNKRSAFVYRNTMRQPCFPLMALEVPPKKGAHPPEFVPALTEDALLKCLTVSDVRELAHFEQLSISNPMDLGGRIGPTVEMAPGSLPRAVVDLNAATFALVALLFFAIVYFGAFAREAVTSAAFPVPGTLFGAFSKSWSTLVVLLVAIWIPLVASVLVASASRKFLFAVCALFVGRAILSVHLVLATKSYFRGLDPRTWGKLWQQNTARIPVSPEAKE